MKLILSQEEINAAFGCRLQELGLANLNKSSIIVTFKSTRGVDGSTEAEVDFEFLEPNTKQANCPPVQENSPVAMAETKERDEAPVDTDTDPVPDADEGDKSDSSDSLSGIFNKG